MDADVLSEIQRDDYRVREIVRDGDVVVDVGAYVGYFARFVLDTAPGAHVISLEPMPSNNAALVDNVGDEVTVERLALADRNGPLTIYDFGDDASACHSIYDLGVDDAAPVEVEAVTLDELLRRHSLSNVRLLKLDCQGAEYDALTATPESVLRRIDYLSIEVHDGIAKSGAGLGRVPHAHERQDELYRHLGRTHVRIEGGRRSSVQVWARRDLVSDRTHAVLRLRELSARVGWPATYQRLHAARWTARHYADSILNVRDVARALKGLPRYVADRRRYRRLPGAEPLSLVNDNPQLRDRTAGTPYDAHYLHQDAWAARRIAERRPARHVDVGSRTTFVAGLAAFVDVVFVDIRPLDAQVPGLTPMKGSLLALPFEDRAVDSLSCLHVAEHVGLGRYGDALDPAGTRRAAFELQRVLARGGELLFSLPVGEPRTAFNAHRIHDPTDVVGFFPELELLEFSGIDDAGDFLEDEAPDRLVGAGWSCGLYRFTRRA
jgi:FkbM family methyltransferase